MNVPQRARHACNIHSFLSVIHPFRAVCTRARSVRGVNLRGLLTFDFAVRPLRFLRKGFSYQLTLSSVSIFAFSSTFNALPAPITLAFTTLLDNGAHARCALAQICAEKWRVKCSQTSHGARNVGVFNFWRAPYVYPNLLEATLGSLLKSRQFSGPHRLRYLLQTREP